MSDIKPPYPAPCFVAVVRTWPQVGPEDADLHIVTKIFTGNETVKDVMDWVTSKHGTNLNVTLTKAE